MYIGLQHMQVLSLFSPFFSILVYAGALVRCHKGSVLILLILQRRLLGTDGSFLWLEFFVALFA